MGRPADRAGGPGTEIRRTDRGGLALCLLRLEKGVDTRPLFKGMPDDECQCTHWGYMISGTIRVHAATGSTDYEAGETYHWAPGHNLEAITDCEYLEISRVRRVRRADGALPAGDGRRGLSASRLSARPAPPHGAAPGG